MFEPVIALPTFGTTWMALYDILPSTVKKNEGGDVTPQSQ